MHRDDVRVRELRQRVVLALELQLQILPARVIQGHRQTLERVGFPARLVAHAKDLAGATAPEQRFGHVTLGYGRMGIQRERDCGNLRAP